MPNVTGSRVKRTWWMIIRSCVYTDSLVLFPVLMIFWLWRTSAFDYFFFTSDYFLFKKINHSSEYPICRIFLPFKYFPRKLSVGWSFSACNSHSYICSWGGCWRLHSNTICCSQSVFSQIKMGGLSHRRESCFLGSETDSIYQDFCNCMYC